MGKVIFIVFLLSALIPAVYIDDLIAEIAFNESYEKAQAGNVREQLRLGQLYHKGKFTGVDFEKAEYWFDIAAENGSTVAAEILCNEFQKGCNAKRP